MAFLFALSALPALSFASFVYHGLPLSAIVFTSSANILCLYNVATTMNNPEGATRRLLHVFYPFDIDSSSKHRTNVASNNRFPNTNPHNTHSAKQWLQVSSPISSRRVGDTCSSRTSGKEHKVWHS